MVRPECRSTRSSNPLPEWISTITSDTFTTRGREKQRRRMNCEKMLSALTFICVRGPSTSFASAFKPQNAFKSIYNYTPLCTGVITSHVGYLACTIYLQSTSKNRDHEEFKKPLQNLIQDPDQTRIVFISVSAV